MTSKEQERQFKTQIVRSLNSLSGLENIEYLVKNDGGVLSKNAKRRLCSILSKRITILLDSMLYDEAMVGV